MSNIRNLPRVVRTLTVHPGTRYPDLVIEADERQAWLLIAPTPDELVKLAASGYDRQYVPFPTGALDRFADGGFQPIVERDIKISRSKGVIEIAFWQNPKVEIVRQYGETVLQQAFELMREAETEEHILLNRLENRARGRQPQGQKPDAQAAKPQDALEQVKREARMQGNLPRLQQPQGGNPHHESRRDGRGRPDGRGQKPNPPQQGRKPEPRRETQPQPKPGHGERQPIPVQQSASDAANGGVKIGLATLADKFGSLKLPTVVAEAPTDSETKVEEFKDALSEVVATEAAAETTVSDEAKADETCGCEAPVDTTAFTDALMTTRVTELADGSVEMTEEDEQKLVGEIFNAAVAKADEVIAEAVAQATAPEAPKPRKATKPAAKAAPDASPAPKAKEKTEAKPEKKAKSRKLSPAELEQQELLNIGK